MSKPDKHETKGNTVTEILLLEDHSMEIPACLLRVEGGGFKYPWMLNPLSCGELKPIEIYTPTTTYPDNEKDRKARAEILAQQAMGTVIDEQYERQKRADKKAERLAKKQQLQQNKLRQRKEFLKHFKWSF